MKEGYVLSFMSGIYRLCICNWMGNKSLTRALQWSGDEDINSSLDYDLSYGDNNDIKGG